MTQQTSEDDFSLDDKIRLVFEADAQIPGSRVSILVPTLQAPTPVVFELTSKPNVS